MTIRVIEIINAAISLKKIEQFSEGRIFTVILKTCYLNLACVDFTVVLLFICQFMTENNIYESARKQKKKYLHGTRRLKHQKTSAIL